MSKLEALRSRILNAQRNLDALREVHKSELDALHGSWQRKHDELQSEVRAYTEKCETAEAAYAKLSAEHKELVGLVEALLRSIDNATAHVVAETAVPAKDETALTIPTAPAAAKTMSDVRERLFYLADQIDFSGTPLEDNKPEDNRPAAEQAANASVDPLRGALDRAALEITEREDLRHLKGSLKVVLR